MSKSIEIFRDSSDEEKVDNSSSGEETLAEKRSKQLSAEQIKEASERFEKAISPEHLQMISQASGGFRFRPDVDIPPGRTGYTDLKSRTIYYNPLMLHGSPELGIEPWDKTDIRGFTYHEAGHHAPEVVALQNQLLGDLKKIEIPEAYKGSSSAEERFVAAIWSNLDNTLADMWLESFMGRRPYYVIRKDITEFQTGKGEIEDYKGISRPEQLMQVILRSRYFKMEGLEEKVSPEVLDSYNKIMKSGAMNAIIERSPFENYFASPSQREKCIDKKMEAYRQIFLPEYLKLLEAELEERKKQRQQQKQSASAEGSGETKQGQEGEAGKSEPQAIPSESAPLTKKEEEEIKQQILEELDKAGKERESQAPSEEEQEQINSTMQKVRKLLKQERARREGKISEKPEEDEEPKEFNHGKEKKGEEAIKELGKEFERKQREKSRKGVAEVMGVNPEVIKKWEDTKEKYKREIISLSSLLAEVFLDDRRKKMEYLKRRGDIVPGLEYETIAAQASGEADPQTKMSIVRNPEFLETELEFIVDSSGSMSGNKIEKSVELLVVITESLKKVRELLANENLLTLESEQPFRIGVTKFSDYPERITRLIDPLNDKKEVDIINKVSEIGGGTEESAAISGVYQELKLDERNVIKIICVLTDGQGNQDGVRPVIQQIEKDKEVVFLAVGLGDNKESAQAIVRTYLDPLDKEGGNVHGFAAENPDQALAGVSEFLKREVNKRKHY